MTQNRSEPAQLTSAHLSKWRLKDFAPGEGDPASACRGAGGGWIAATAPGDTYLALIEAGRLAHPFAGREEAAAAWVRDREWWWHTRFDLTEAAPSEMVELVFDGLDTFADIWLDGHLLGRADNMFRSWRFDLSGVAPGCRDLAVRFHPPSIMTGDRPLPNWSVATDRISRTRRTAMRKAQFGWGWDWGPDLPTVGIWKSVRIERRRSAVVRSVNFSTLTIDHGTAQVAIDIDLSEPADATVELLSPDGERVWQGHRRGSGRIEAAIADARLWWSADLGEQPLYTLVVRIAGAPDYSRQVGIRTIAIDQSPDPDEPGTTFFRFVLNGVPIFAKGVNWVPANSFVGAVPDATYRDLLARAASANMNMVRVWGGGIYEPDLFYDECDRLGLLVWQDFMFANGPDPDDDPAFLDNIRAEVREQVARLRHHACLALWCGNNESHGIHWLQAALTGVAERHAGLTIYDEIIPAALDELDPATPWWPSSPWGGPSPNSMRGGDVHNWTVWHGFPPVPDVELDGGYLSAPEGVAFTRYQEDMARFVSEFGLQAAPTLATLERWMAPDDLALKSPGFLDRIKDVADKAAAMMATVTGPPETLADYVDFTMVAQAEGLKFGIEHYRRRKPHCSGALIWQHNDCWPCVSWSLIDHDGVAKAGWYAVRRAFAPVLASFRRVGDGVELWVTNDTLAPVHDAAIVSLASFAGEIAWQAEVAIEVPANASRCVWRGVAADADDQVLMVRSAADAFPANRLLLAPVKDLALAPDAGINTVCEPVAAGLRVTVSATRYALTVNLCSDDPRLRFSDGHFDLAAGETRTVIVSHVDDGAVRAEHVTLSSWNDRSPRPLAG
ncbi:beta-mannosidase [Sphingomonas sp. Y38-1Y]|uniref:beta-mannosidase n=1 Tax=Sphingomonas sp. Y38-1Y TaxID=3078265 RepID=UPI0028E8FFFC|nr:glycoside hydrolase family 2 protein [Sphingomonas sp. Y38-1Y]